MIHTRFYDDRSVVVPGRVPAYEPRAGGGFRLDWSTNFEKVGDGGLMSSVDDLLLWDRNFYDNKLGKGSLVRELQTQGVLNNGKTIEYALGLVVSKYRGLPVVGHGGALFGYRTEILRFPQQKFSVLTLCNLGTSDPNRLSEQVADIYLEGQLTPDRIATETAHADSNAFAGLYRDSESHSVLEISAVEGDLVARGTRFKPTGPGRYAVVSGPEMSFESQSGGSLRMTLTSTDTAPQIFERFQPVKPSAEDLAQYAGEYKSDELDAIYKFAVKDGKLTYTTHWHEPATLEPSIRDEFQGPLGVSVVFRRNAAGRVIGCDFFAGRVRDISFARE